MNSSSIPFPQRSGKPERPVPQSLEAEQSTLGAMLTERNAVARAVEILTIEDFYRELHKKIFKSMLKLFDKGEPTDIAVVTEDLRRSGMLEEVGGPDYLSALIEACPNSANIETYARIVKDKSIRRKVIHTSNYIDYLAHDLSISTKEVLRLSKLKLLELERSNSQSLDSAASLSDKLRIGFQYTASNKGIATGFAALDDLLGGLQRTNFIVLAARPSIGKTALCLNIAYHIALKERLPVAIFSLEMSKEQLVQRLVCSEASVKSQDLRRGRVQDGDWHRLSNAHNNLQQSPIFIDDQPGQSASEMRAKAQRLTKEHGQLGLIVIDYLQLAHSSGKPENRVQEISEIARALKSMARELDCPVIALSQLSRALEQRENKRPILTDLKESGSIEDIADIVAFIYRDSYYRRKALHKAGQPAQPAKSNDVAEIIIGKHRNGPVGTIKLGFQPEFAKFTNLAPDEFGGGY